MPRTAHKALFSWMPALLLFVMPAGAQLSGVGFEAIGYLVYSRFDVSGKVMFKEVTVFDAQMGSNQWRIRTEPLSKVENGISYYEASGELTGGALLMITAFRTNSSTAESVLEQFRVSHKELLQLSESSTRIATKRVAALTSGASPNTNANPGKLSKSHEAQMITNAAVAVVMGSSVPPVDPSYAALLWFCFTAPTVRSNDLIKMLPQLWDDGNRETIRFREASWHEFASPPGLVSHAVFHWLGQEQDGAGKVSGINSTGVSDTQAVAAQYDVSQTTNLIEWTVPLNCRLTRFLGKPPVNRRDVVASVIDVTVIRVTQLPKDVSLTASLPGRTIISDYRISRELSGLPMTYMVDSNAPPSTQQLQGTALYRSMLRVPSTDPKGSKGFRVVLLLLVTLPLVVLLSKGAVNIYTRNKRNKNPYV